MKQVKNLAIHFCVFAGVFCAAPLVSLPAKAETTQPATTGPTDAATLVTLHFKDAPAEQVYRSLYDQAHGSFGDRRDAFSRLRKGGTITIDLDRAPFWTAMRELNKQTELAPSNFPGDDSLTEQSMHGPAFASGPFLVTTDNRFGDGRFDELIVYVEPGLRVMSHDREPQIEAALDEDGHRIKCRNVGWPKEDIPGNAFEVRPSFELDGNARIVYLKGYATAWIAEKTKRIEIDNALANNSDRTIDGHRFLFNIMSPVPRQYSLTLVTFDLPDESGISNIEIRLLDVNRKSLAGGGSHGGSGIRGKFSLTSNYQQPANVGEPSTIVISFPSELKRVKIPFEFGKRP